MFCPMKMIVTYNHHLQVFYLEYILTLILGKIIEVACLSDSMTLFMVHFVQQVRFYSCSLNESS